MAAEKRRNGPYIWVTWLTELMAGEKDCEWSSWFKAQHDSSSWTPVPNNGDLALWKMRHASLLDQYRAEMEEDGYVTTVEAQNQFVLKGSTATVSGKPTWWRRTAARSWWSTSRRASPRTAM